MPGVSAGKATSLLQSIAASSAAGDASVDAIDRRLLQGLQQDGRASYAQLGTVVGLSGDAVRERLKRLEGAGLMRVVGVIDPALLGYTSFALVGLRTQGVLEPILARLDAIPEIDFIVCTSGAVEVLVEVVCRDDAHLLDVVNGQIKSIPGVVMSETFSYLGVAKWMQGGYRHARRSDGAAVAELGDVDRAIAEHLQRDARAGYQELADAVRQPYSSVRRRVQSLLESGVVQIVTIVDRLRSGLGIMAGVGLCTEGPLKPIVKALTAMAEVEIAVLTTGSFDVLLEVACRDKAHLIDLVGERIRAIRGVRTSQTLTYLRLVKLPLTWTIPAVSAAAGGQKGR